MRKPCIVKPLLTMQGFSIFGPPFFAFRGLRVRARKPDLLALREVEREPRRHPGRLS